MKRSCAVIFILEILILGCIMLGLISCNIKNSNKVNLEKNEILEKIEKIDNIKKIESKIKLQTQKIKNIHKNLINNANSHFNKQANNTEIHKLKNKGGINVDISKVYRKAKQEYISADLGVSLQTPKYESPIIISDYNSNYQPPLPVIYEEPKFYNPPLAIKKIPIYSNSLSNIEKEKYYQGSLFLNLANSTQGVNLKVVNNFIISNSNISQYLESGMQNNSTLTPQSLSTPTKDTLKVQELKTQYEEKLKNFEDANSAKLNLLKLEMESKLAKLQDLNFKEEEKIKEYKMKLSDFNNSSILEKESLKMEYENKIKELVLKLQEEMNILKTKEIEIIEKNMEIKKLNQDMKKLNETICIKEKTLLKENLTKSFQQLKNDTQGKIIEPKKTLIQQSKDELKPTKMIPHSYNTVQTPIVKMPAISTPPKPSQLACIDLNSLEFHHFLMNYEKCKNLNELYLALLPYFIIKSNQLNEIYCEYQCSFEILIKFTSDNTEISLMENKGSKLNLIKSITIQPAAYLIKIRGGNMKTMEKELLKNFITVYLYQHLTGMLKLLPEYSRYIIQVVAEGEYYESMDYMEKSRFIKSLLYLATIDDRFRFEWNNIRFINRNEKKLNDFLLLKDSAKKASIGQGNVLSLNFDKKGGVNIIGSESSSSSSSSSSSIDSSLNPVDDSSKSSIQIQSGNSKENIYSKNVDLVGLNNIEGSIINSIASSSQDSQKKEIPIIVKNRYVGELRERKLDDRDVNEENNINMLEIKKNKLIGNSENFSNDHKKQLFLQNFSKSNIQINSLKQELENENKIKKFLNDPLITKLREYLHDNSIIDEYYKNISEEIEKDIKLKEKDNQYANKLKIPEVYLKNINVDNLNSYSEVLYPNQLNKNNYSNFRFREVRPKETDKIEKSYLTSEKKVGNSTSNYQQNPCFNKGYYDKDLNILGTGDYSKCYRYIVSNFADDVKNSNFTVSSFDQNSDCNQKECRIILGKEFKKINFLFYQKETENHFKFNEEMKYVDLKNKIKNLCSLQYSHLLGKISSFHISNFSKLCFDLTYFTVIFDKNKILDNFVVVIKSHISNKNKTDNINEIYVKILSLITNHNNLHHFITFCISSLLSILLCICNNKLSAFISTIIFKFTKNFYCKLIPSNEEIEDFLTFFKVKCFLFYDENSYFIKKYGKDFNYEQSLEKEDLLKEIKEIYSKNDELRNLVEENRKYLLELKIAISIHLLHIIMLMTSVISFCFLLRNVQLELGTVKAITTLLSVFFILIVIAISFKISLKYEIFANRGQEELDKESLVQNNFNNKELKVTLIEKF
jgi:hypothetical protein